MRFFLCAFGAFSLGVPVHAVSSLITVPWEVEQIVDRDRDENTYFSLPHFFGSLGKWSFDQDIRHGFILKPQVQQVPLLSGGNEEDTDVSTEAVVERFGWRNVLLVTAVEREIDIPQEEIQALPDILVVDKMLSFFTGISFNSSVMNIFIDPAILIPRMLLAGEHRESLDGER